MSISEVAIAITFYFIAFLIATIGREIFFGLMALRYGDETPQLQQRITLNPIRHIDWFGTIILPFTFIVMGLNFMFGYAKPMPINFQNIQNKMGYKGCLYVSLAGTFFNFLVALSAIAVLRIGFKYGFIEMDDLVFGFFMIVLQVNIMIAIFNLLPIPPLDGAKILAYSGLCFKNAIFARWYNNLEKYGMIIIILLLLLPPTQEGIIWIMRNVVLLFLKL